MNSMFLTVAAANPFERFGVNWYDFASQAIAFLIIAWILNKFVFKPVMNVVAERQRVADEAAADSVRIKQELQAVEEERAKAMQAAQEKADQVVSEAKKHVAEMISQEKQRCEALGNEMLTQAREEAKLDQARLQTEMRGEIASMIVSLTAKLAQMNLQESDRERMLQSAIDELTATTTEAPQS